MQLVHRIGGSDMLNVSWVLVLVTPTLLWSTAHCPASQIGNNGFVVKYPVVYGVPAHIAGGYCHRVFETQMLPYFAQFPVVELDRTSASFWPASFIGRILRATAISGIGRQDGVMLPSQWGCKMAGSSPDPDSLRFTVVSASSNQVKPRSDSPIQ